MFFSEGVVVTPATPDIRAYTPGEAPRRAPAIGVGVTLFPPHVPLANDCAEGAEPWVLSDR